MVTFNDIAKANESIRVTDIKGKDYAEVNQRIKAFRMVFPNGTINTEIISISDGVCVMRASVQDEEGKLIGTGTAYEKESSSFINKTSYIENCETSAVGRALGMCGFGIDTSIASYEEVANAIENQGEKPKKAEPKKTTKKTEPKEEPKAEPQMAAPLITPEQKAVLFAEMERTMVSKETICQAYRINSIDDMDVVMFASCKNRLKATKTKTKE